MIKANTSLEWREILEDDIGKNLIKFHSFIGFLLNLIVPVILLVFFKVDIITYLLCFIIFDILQVFLESGILFVHKNINNISWIIQKGRYQKKVKDMSPGEVELLKKDLNTTQSFYNEKLNIINEKINEFKSLEEVATPSSRKNEIIYVEEMILKFKNYDGISWIKDYMNTIVDTSERLISLIKDDEESIVIVINTYNIYSEELLKIVSSYEDMDDEQKDRYQSKIISLLDDFCEHLTNLEDRIISFKEHSIDFDIDFLQKKLKEDKEKDV